MKIEQHNNDVKTSPLIEHLIAIQLRLLDNKYATRTRIKTSKYAEPAEWYLAER